MIDILSMVPYAFIRHMLTLLFVNEILLSRYVNFLLILEAFLMAPSLKLKKFAFTERLMTSAAYSRLCSRDSAWASLFVGSARLYA